MEIHPIMSLEKSFCKLIKMYLKGTEMSEQQFMSVQLTADKSGQSNRYFHPYSHAC